MRGEVRGGVPTHDPVRPASARCRKSQQGTGIGCRYIVVWNLSAHRISILLQLVP